MKTNENVIQEMARALMSKKEQFLLMFSFFMIFTLPTQSVAQPLSAYKNGHIIIYSKENHYWLVFQDSHGFIWGYDKYNRVIRFDGTEYKIIKSDPNDTNRLMFTDRPIFHEDREGKIWIRILTCGVARCDLQKRNFKNYFESNGLASNTTFSLIEDDKQNIWISSKYNLTQYNKDRNSFFSFSWKDGIPVEFFSDKFGADTIADNHFALTGVQSDKYGNLFFRTKDGVIYFHPDSVKIDTVVPKLVFTDFQLSNVSVKVGDKTGILNKSITFTEKILLKPGQDVFTISFSALEYLFPEKIQYAFILRGYDDDWRYVENTREATYTNLNPGKYTFLVKCRNRHGFWSPEPLSLDIEILPPWYSTDLAYALWFILLFGGGYASYRFQLNRKLAAAETQHTKELDAIKTRLYTTQYWQETRAHEAIEAKPTLDDLFLQNLKIIIENNISDVGLNIHHLERELNMSRTKIYRKLTALTDMSATEFIRSVRLNKASEILRGGGNKTISEIAYDVGFTSLSYFTRRFHEMFGVSPTEWREGKK